MGGELAEGPGRAQRVIVAEDDPASLLLLRFLLEKDGFVVQAVADGAQAVAAFAAEPADFVLLDISMPVMDGYEAAHSIKALAGEQFVPVMFLTAITDEAALAQCIEAGGDDFLSKPYSRLILSAKMQALARTRDLHRTLSAQRDVLADYHHRNEQSQELTRQIFARMLRRWPDDLAGVRYMLRPSERLNGDTILLGRSPCGRLNAMLGDFTGHGLSAAVGTLPTAELFYDMTARGRALQDLVITLDARLAELLPANLFCASALVSLDPARGTLTVWNGGLPDLVLMGPAGLRRFPSRNLPLGIVGARARTPQLELLEVAAEDRLYLFSDGLTELRIAGHAVGQAAVEEIIATAADPFQQLVQLVESGAAAQHDDITLLEISATATVADAVVAPLPAQSDGTAWRITLELGPAALRQGDAVPMVVNTIENMQQLGEQRSRLYTVLAELISNAVDHGVLQLDSRLKASADGFEHYYQQREQALAALEEGQIRVVCINELVGQQGGRFTLRIEDSGSGFDFRRFAEGCGDEEGRLCGRGLQLVRSLCERVQFEEPGNRVEAVIPWGRAV